MSKLSQKEVLSYRKGGPSSETVKRHYVRWLAQQVPPRRVRCEIEGCIFQQSPLIWNGQELKLVLDHKNGVNGDNSPENLRFLCPNCNSQQPTHGGGNKGKVEQSIGGFAKIRADGKKDFTLPADHGEFNLRVSEGIKLNKKAANPLSPKKTKRGPQIITLRKP